MGIATVLSSGAAFGGAAELFQDDFETGTLLYNASPPGAWSNVESAAGGQTTVAVVSAAAHRGSYGLRHSDNDASTGAGEQTGVTYFHAPVRGAYHLRAWVRITGTSAEGTITPITIMARPTGTVLAEMIYSRTTRLLSVASRTGANADYVIAAGARAVEDGQWVLIELALSGIGTAQGRAELRVNGVLDGVLEGLSWSDLRYEASRIYVGQIWSDDRRFTGTTDFDDVRLSSIAPASHLRVVAAPMAPSGCAELQVTLADSAARAAAPAPYRTEVELDSSPAGTFFPTADCAGPAAQFIAIAEDASAAAVWFRPAAGAPSTVHARHPDFLPGSASTPVANPQIPHIREVPQARLSCGAAWEQPLSVDSKGPFELHLRPADGHGTLPEGLVLDPDSARMLWTPDSRHAGEHAWRVEAVGPEGSSAIEVRAVVRCADPWVAGCGAAPSEGAGWLAVVAVAIGCVRRREGSAQ